MEWSRLVMNAFLLENNAIKQMGGAVNLAIYIPLIYN